MAKSIGPRVRTGRPAAKVGGPTFMQQVGSKIREARGDDTLEDVAGRTDGLLSAGMISQYESGRMEPRLSKITILAAALGVTLFDLLPPSAQSVKSPLVGLIADIRRKPS